MHDPDIWREQQIADEWWEAWTEQQLDRLWAIHADDIPWTDAVPQGTEASSKERPMRKFNWPASVAVTCIIWGTLILLSQHHLSNLIPVLGAYLIAYGAGLLAAMRFLGRR